MKPKLNRSFGIFYKIIALLSTESDLLTCFIHYPFNRILRTLIFYLQVASKTANAKFHSNHLKIKDHTSKFTHIFLCKHFFVVFWTHVKFEHICKIMTSFMNKSNWFTLQTTTAARRSWTTWGWSATSSSSERCPSSRRSRATKDRSVADIKLLSWNTDIVIVVIVIN